MFKETSICVCFMFNFGTICHFYVSSFLSHLSGVTNTAQLQNTRNNWPTPAYVMSRSFGDGMEAVKTPFISLAIRKTKTNDQNL